MFHLIFSDSSQEEVVEERVDDLTVDQRIERLMSTITGENEAGDHIVIVQDGEHIQVIDTGDTPVEGKNILHILYLCFIYVAKVLIHSLSTFGVKNLLCNF